MIKTGQKLISFTETTIFLYTFITNLDTSNIIICKFRTFNNKTYLFCQTVMGNNIAPLQNTPEGRLLHSKYFSALFKQKSEGPHFWFLQFGSL